MSGLRISLFGIGYVGSVSAACLARDGHDVIAVDINPDKVAALNESRMFTVEPGVDGLISCAVKSGKLRAIGSAQDAVAQTEISIVCVGTPSAPDGSLDSLAVERVAVAIGGALENKGAFHTVVIRSTLTPGVMTTRILPLLEQASGLEAGVDFGLAYYPEFLREGAAIRDYDDPSSAVMAATDPETLKAVLSLHPQSAAPPIVTSFKEAEANKMISNIWRAFKIGFANEVGGVLSGLGVDSHKVMDAVCADRRFNVSPTYMRPGFAFGGSCLPKDLRAFAALGNAVGRKTTMAEALIKANQESIDYAASRVEAAGGRRVSIIGLAFKPHTDDLRESPYVHLAEQLIAKGFDLRLYDPDVRHERLTGANLAYADERLPTLSSLLCSTLEEVVRHGETLVLAHPDLGRAALELASDKQRIVDLTRVRPDLVTGGNYEGLAW